MDLKNEPPDLKNGQPDLKNGAPDRKNKPPDLNTLGSVDPTHFSGQMGHFSGQVVHFSGQVVHFSGQVPIFQVVFRVSRPEGGPKKHPFLIIRCTYGAYRDHTPGAREHPSARVMGGVSCCDALCRERTGGEPNLPKSTSFYI